MTDQSFEGFTKPEEKKPQCEFCHIQMRPIQLIRKNYLAQLWRFKCPNCEIEFEAWI